MAWDDDSNPYALASQHVVSPLNAMGVDPDEAMSNRAEILARARMTPLERIQNAAKTPPMNTYGMAGLGAPNPDATTASPKGTPGDMTSPSGAAPSITPSSVSPTGNTTTTPAVPSLRQRQMETADAAMRSAKSAEDAANAIQVEDPQMESLERQRSGIATPTNRNAVDPNTGKPLYKPGIGSKIARGLEAVGLGLATGGIRGALGGVISPASVGVKGYNAPNTAYDRAEATRTGELASVDQQISNEASRWKEANDARKAQAATLKDVGPMYNQANAAYKDINSAAAANQRNEEALRKIGMKHDDQNNIVPLTREEMSPQQVQKLDDDQALQGLREAQTELASAKNDPNSPAYKLAYGRLQTAQQNAQTALSRLGLSTQQFLMHSRGVDENGIPLPGAMIGADGQPVGTAFQENVRPTTGQRDAAGRAMTMDAIQQRIEAGLQDPEILKYMGPGAGRLAEQQGKLGTLPKKVSEFRNDLVSYGAFQAGLHPVKGVKALEYFDNVMGGMGQTPDELAGKLASNRATSAAVQNVGRPRVAGGGGVPAPIPAAPASPTVAAPAPTPKATHRFNKATGQIEEVK